MQKRYRTSGIVGVALGGLLLAKAFIGGEPVQGEGAYAMGQKMGLLMAGVMFVAGLYYLRKAKDEGTEE